MFFWVNVGAYMPHRSLRLPDPSWLILRGYSSMSGGDGMIERQRAASGGDKTEPRNTPCPGHRLMTRTGQTQKAGQSEMIH